MGVIQYFKKKWEEGNIRREERKRNRKPSRIEEYLQEKLEGARAHQKDLKSKTWKERREERKNKPTTVLGEFFNGIIIGIGMILFSVVPLGVGALLCTTIIGAILGIPLVIFGFGLICCALVAPFSMAWQAIQQESIALGCSAELKRKAKEAKEREAMGLPEEAPETQEKAPWAQNVIPQEGTPMWEEQQIEKIQEQKRLERIAEERLAEEEKANPPFVPDGMTVDLGHGNKVPFKKLPDPLRKKIIEQCRETEENLETE